METPLEKLNAKLLREHLHSKFKVLTENTPVMDLELCEVNEPPTLPKLELFTLLFRGPASPCLSQRVHCLENAKLGKVHMFLTAIAGDTQEILYEAVFNRMRQQPAVK